MYSLHAFLKSKLEEEFETEFRVFSPKPGTTDLFSGLETILIQNTDPYTHQVYQMDWRGKASNLVEDWEMRILPEIRNEFLKFQSENPGSIRKRVPYLEIKSNPMLELMNRLDNYPLLPRSVDYRYLEARILAEKV